MCATARCYARDGKQIGEITVEAMKSGTTLGGRKRGPRKKNIRKLIGLVAIFKQRKQNK